jgi:hypothetical protein
LAIPKIVEEHKARSVKDGPAVSRKLKIEWRVITAPAVKEKLPHMEQELQSPSKGKTIHYQAN